MARLGFSFNVGKSGNNLWGVPVKGLYGCALLSLFADRDLVPDLWIMTDLLHEEMAELVAVAKAALEPLQPKATAPKKKATAKKAPAKKKPATTAPVKKAAARRK